jgi:hypothetical protein
VQGIEVIVTKEEPTMRRWIFAHTRSTAKSKSELHTLSKFPRKC